ncbi:ROK family protein [Pedobacter antarcticus]|nr:ROK family protein [Pedobacter antarcticus]
MNEEQLQEMSKTERKKYLYKLKLIRNIFDFGPQSNAELFTLLGISSPTSLALLSELQEENILEKKGKGASIGGRKPELFGLKDDTYYILSIDVERFKVRMAVLDNNCNYITGPVKHDITITPDLKSLDSLFEAIELLIKSAIFDHRKLIGIGMSMPGLVDSRAGKNYTYLIPGPEDNLQELMQRKLGYPVFIQNDVKSATIAECRYGLAYGKSDALLVLMDWGIGLGIIMDGKLRSGSKGFSGEIGHIPFVEDGKLCYCGKRGCLETVASGIALARMAKEGIQSGKSSILNQLSDQEIETIEPRIIIDAANKGDQYAINILSEVGVSLGRGIATLIQLFNPEVIILGGKIAAAKQYITIPILHSVNTYSMTAIRENTKVILSELGNDAGILGTVSMVIDKVLEMQIEMAGKS